MSQLYRVAHLFCLLQFPGLPQDGRHQRRQSRREALLQRGPDQVLRHQAQEGVRAELLVGTVPEVQARKAGHPQGQSTLLVTLVRIIATLARFCLFIVII
jgi:hypothetical protein